MASKCTERALLVYLTEKSCGEKLRVKYIVENLTAWYKSTWSQEAKEQWRGPIFGSVVRSLASAQAARAYEDNTNPSE